MNKPKNIAVALAFVLLLSISGSFAQSEPSSEPSFEIILQTLTASNDVGDTAILPASLAETVDKLKLNLSFSNFKVVSTHIERIANKGSLQFRSVLSGFNQDETATASSNWVLSDLNSLIDARGRPVVEFKHLGFETDIPFNTTVFNEKSERMIPAIGYDAIRLNNQRINISESQPTVIGTLALPKSGKHLILIITVKPASK